MDALPLLSIITLAQPYYAILRYVLLGILLIAMGLAVWGSVLAVRSWLHQRNETEKERE